MPVVKTKRIVYVSSEDVIHCGANLLSPSVSLQWLSDAVNQGNNKRIEIIIELAKLSRIKQIEIGNMGSAFVEVLVKSSSIENGEDYLSLLPQSMLMSAEESRSNRNLTRTKLFLTDKLSKVAVEKKWLYLKIVCLQPFCGKQFGLRFIKLFSHSPTDETATPSFTSPSSLTPGRLLSPPELIATPSKLMKIGSPNQRSLSEPRPINKTTPSRKRICDNDSQEFEFYGLETQSRLLKNTLRNDTSTIKDNSILSRIAADRRISTKGKEGESNDSGFAKKKLLVKELPKVESINYLDSYKAKNDSQNTNRYSMMKLSSLDDNSEIGEDILKRKRHMKKKSVKIPSRQWINTRKKPCTDNILPDGMKSLPQDNTKQNSLEAYFTKEVDEVITIDDDDNSNATCSSHSEPGGVSDDGLVNCPICNTRIPLYAVEMHASTCAENTFDKSSGKPLADNDVIWCN